MSCTPTIGVAAKTHLIAVGAFSKTIKLSVKITAIEFEKKKISKKTNVANPEA